MPHRFAIGDVVTLNGTEQKFEVKGFSKGDNRRGELLHLEFVGNPSAGKIYIPPASVTLVRSGGEAQASHPSKIET
jgi:hypothetical protein